MRVLFYWLCGLWTLGGAGLLLQEAGSPIWWDVVWVLFLALTSYASLASTYGLAHARVSAGVVLVVFSGMLLLTALCGWPLGPIQFAGPSALRLGNAFPLLPPLLAFSLLTLSQRALAVAFPNLGTNALALSVAGVFTASVCNGLAFLVKARLWWLWNPWGEGAAILPACIGILSLALAGFFLARIYPEDTALKLKRWSSEAGVLIIVNIVFLAANVLFLAGRL
jgi:hypothetical protein